MLGAVGRVYQFFAAHSKRHKAFEASIDKCQPASSSKKTEGRVKHDGFSVLMLLTSLYSSLCVLLIAWRTSAMMVQVCGVQILSLMLRG